MCGIVGEVRFDGKDVEQENILRMRDSLLHRGPDDAGVYVARDVGLGHRRLSIIDLSPLGRQPMWSASGRLAIVFNGEVYNYQEIGRDLESLGYRCKGTSDTEVVVNALECYGVEQALARFIGMFAMAVWDTREHTLLLCRDRLGVKPLYYAQDADRILFSSELRALLAHPSFPRELDREALARHLVAGHFGARETVFQQARKVLPGTFLRFSSDGACREQRYWSLPSNQRGAFVGSFEAACSRLHELLCDSLRYRLIADVPVGLFLSSGVDSSLLAAILRRDLRVDVSSFTIGFREATFDESAMASRLCKSLGMRHVVSRVASEEAQQVLDKFCDIFDEPFGDSSGIPTFLVSRLAQTQVKVALSADGGDEQFCGYTGQRAYPLLFLRFSRLPLSLRKALVGLVRRRLPYENLLSLSWPGLDRTRKTNRIARFEKLLALIECESEQCVARLYRNRGFNEQQANNLLGLQRDTLRLVDDVPLSPERTTLPDLADALMRGDCREWLPDDILLKVDRASMAASLEARDPLLDHRITEFAFSLPFSYLCAGGVQKRILRHLLAGLTTAETAARPKLGFDIPLDEWLRGCWKTSVEQYLAPEAVNKAGILAPDLVASEVRHFLALNGRSPARVWLMLNLQMWANRWLV